jgi:membrane protease YdiL (CAAX protease family)
VEPSFADSAPIASSSGGAHRVGREVPVTDPARRRLDPRFGALVAWSAVFIGGLILAALLAPIAYSAFITIAPDTRVTLSRVFNRAAMVTAVVFMIAFRRHLGWPDLWRLLGRGAWAQRGAEVGVGLAAAIIAVLACAGWAFATDRIGPTLNEYHFISGRTAVTLLGGLAAGLIEESFFRGLMLASLTVSIGWRAAALTSSVAYSAVHLLSSDRSFQWHGYSVGAGLAYLVHAVSRQLEPATIPPLVGLFIGGLALAVVVRVTGSLYLAIGIHAGWILCFQVLRHATRVLGEITGSSYLATHHYLVGTGWAWAAIALSGALAVGWARLTAARSADGGAS